MKKNLFTIGETAKIFGVSTKTLRNWDKSKNFCPDHSQDGQRRYSRKLIEGNLKKTIEETLDPVISLDEDGIESLKWLADGKFTGIFDFYNTVGDTIKEKYEALYFLINRLGVSLNRTNKTSAPTFILTSPEISTIFTAGCAGFYPVNSVVNPKPQVVLEGVLDNKWKVYSSVLVGADEIIIGTVKDAEVQFENDYVAVIKVMNYVDDDPWNVNGDSKKKVFYDIRNDGELTDSAYDISENQVSMPLGDKLVVIMTNKQLERLAANLRVSDRVLKQMGMMN